MKKVFLLLGVFLIAPPIARGETPAPFKIEIAIDDSSLNTDFYKKTGRFYTKAKIANTSGQDQTITVWTQQGWSWVSDSSYIHPGIEAMQNISHDVTLAPGEEYDETIETLSDPGAKKPITFRLGFSPGAKRPATANSLDNDPINWSNAVTLPAE